jgi:hypothetical protein
MRTVRCHHGAYVTLTSIFGFVLWIEKYVKYRPRKHQICTDLVIFYTKTITGAPGRLSSFLPLRFTYPQQSCFHWKLYWFWFKADISTSNFLTVKDESYCQYQAILSNRRSFPSLNFPLHSIFKNLSAWKDSFRSKHPLLRILVMIGLSINVLADTRLLEHYTIFAWYFFKWSKLTEINTVELQKREHKAI